MANENIGADAARRLQALRKRKAGGRPPVLKECQFCKESFTARNLRAHLPECPARVKVGKYLSKKVRKGGQATGMKAFAAMDLEVGAEITKKGLETRKKNAAKRGAAKKKVIRKGKKS